LGILVVSAFLYFKPSSVFGLATAINGVLFKNGPARNRCQLLTLLEHVV
jgi:hypothetical protein